MNTPDYKNTTLPWFDQYPATYLTDYLFCFSQLLIVVFLRYKVNKISSEFDSYFQQKTILWFVAAYNFWLGLGFGIGGLYHNIYDMTKGPVFSNYIYWRIAVFTGTLAIPFSIMVPVLQVVFIEKKKLIIINIVVVVVALVYALEEALYEKIGFGINMLFVTILWFISSAGIKLFGVKTVGSVRPLYLWLGAGSLIAGILYYTSIKKGCDQWAAYPVFCPFPAWFNHNALLHVLFVVAYWLTTFAWVPGTDCELVQSLNS